MREELLRVSPQGSSDLDELHYIDSTLPAFMRPTMEGVRLSRAAKSRCVRPACRRVEIAIVIGVDVREFPGLRSVDWGTVISPKMEQIWYRKPRLALIMRAIRVNRSSDLATRWPDTDAEWKGAMLDINEAQMEGRPAHMIAWAFGCAMSALFCRAFRLFVYGVLVICGPVLRVASSTIALLGIVAAVVLELSGSAPHFPFWGAMLLFGGCGLFPVLHRRVLRLVAP